MNKAIQSGEYVLAEALLACPTVTVAGVIDEAGDQGKQTRQGSFSPSFTQSELLFCGEDAEKSELGSVGWHCAAWPTCRN